MDRSQRFRDAYELLNSRRFDELSWFAEDLKLHAPGIGVDVEGLEEVRQTVREVAEGADARYEVLDVAELGPFVVGRIRATGTFDGGQQTFEALTIARWDGDVVKELWTLR